MVFNNLIYFLVVIFTVAVDRPPEAPALNPAVSFPLLVLIFVVYAQICARTFARVIHEGSSAFFSAEVRMSILAVVTFVFCLHLFDLKYYLHFLSVGDRLPVLENLGGLGIFIVFFILMWLRGRAAYQTAFHRSYTAVSFIVSNIRVNLPIILPWLVISLCFDLLSMLQIPGVNRLLDSPWGDVVLFLVFVVFLLFAFPPLVRRLWDCRPLPAGPFREEIERFCRRQGFSSEILVWPLFEGQVITAGIMGIIPGFRYLLLTPALLQAMNTEELEAVLAHEIGHVKRMHLVLYICLFLGFSLFAGVAAEPLPFLILGWQGFYRLLEALRISPETLMAVLVSVPFLLLLIVYFRFLFGYFIRNFERQADLYVFKALGGSAPLISSFEKIAYMGGNIRDQKSWHHFGIGERIDFLEKCERDRGLIAKHDRKVRYSMALYFGVVLLSVLLLGRLDHDELAAGFETKYIEAVLEHKLEQDPDNGLLFLLLGDLLHEKKMEKKAIAAYERALQLKPGNADVRNNLAWLLITAGDPNLRDPERALRLASDAVRLKEAGYILDTLAVALWANGFKSEAVAAENRAMEVDPDNTLYYRKQLNRIRKKTWDRSET
jgi:Zn-dependent protease with chaperone function